MQAPAKRFKAGRTGVSARPLNPAAAGRIQADIPPPAFAKEPTMPTSCLALLLAMATSCTLPGSPLTLRVTLAPQADLCVRFTGHAPRCVSALIARLEAHP
jgi:hypothetical protein